MWNIKKFGFKIENFYFFSFVFKIFSLRDKTSMGRVKLIFEMNQNHYEVQSGLSTLDPIVAERDTHFTLFHKE